MIAGLLVDGMTRRVPVVPPPGKVILPGSQQAAVIELPLDNTDVEHRGDVSVDLPPPAARQRLLRTLSAPLPVLSLSLWRGDVSGLFYLARRRPLVIIVNDRFDHRPQLQADDRGGAGHPVPRSERRRNDVPSAGPAGAARAADRTADSRQPCATPAATCSSSTSASHVGSRRSSFPWSAALRRPGAADHGSRRPRMDRPGRNRGSDGPAAWPSKPRSPIRSWRRCGSRSPASGRVTCACIRPQTWMRDARSSGAWDR